MTTIYDKLTNTHSPPYKYQHLSAEERTMYILSQARTRTVCVVSVLGILLAMGMFAWLTIPAYYWGSLEFKDVPCKIDDVGISYRGCEPNYGTDGNLVAPELPQSAHGVVAYRECATTGGMAQAEGSTWKRDKCTEEGNDLFAQFTGRTFHPFGRKKVIQTAQAKSRLLSHSGFRSKRREPQCEGTFLAWSLVSFPESPKNEPRCAYRYGAEAASFDPLRSSARFIDRLPIVGSSHTCRVMETSAKNDCIVALQTMTTLIMMEEAITDSDSILILMMPIIFIACVLSLFTIFCRYAVETRKRFSDIIDYNMTSMDFNPEERVAMFLNARRSEEPMTFDTLDVLVDDAVEYHIVGARSIIGANIFDLDQYEGYGKIAFSRLCERLQADVKSKDIKTITKGNVVFHYSSYPWSAVKSIYLKTTFKMERGRIIRMYIEAQWWSFKEEDHWWAAK